MELTLVKATDPNALTVMSMARIMGLDYSAAVVANWLTEADAITGGKTTPEAIAVIARMTVEHMRYRSVGSIVMAIRDGISYTDDDGRIYGVITWPKVKLWLDRHEEAVLEMSRTQHSSTVIKNDNLGRDWLDRQEQGDPREKLIEQLKRKLTIERKKK